MIPYQLKVFVCILFSIVTMYAQDSIKCNPPCRYGYTCINGQCVSMCNPPCPEGQKCTNYGECIPVEKTSAVPAPVNIGSKKQTVHEDIPCVNIFIVRPDLNHENIPGNLQDGELTSASIMVGEAIQKKFSSFGTTSLISVDDLDAINKCTAKLVLAKVLSYHTEPAPLGQHEGIVNLEISFYDSPDQSSPTRTVEFEARGDRHWGDSVPLENAFQEVSKKIRRGLKVK